MKWDEFLVLLAGINEKTALGRIVAIRSETDADALKRFTPEQKKIRADWARAHTRVITDPYEYEAAMAGFKNMFVAMARKEEK